MALESVDIILARRVAEVAARAPRPNLHSDAMAVDASRTAQLKRTAPAVQQPGRAGFHVEHNGAWYSLIGPDGKVGNSQRTEAEAWAQLDAGA